MSNDYLTPQERADYGEEFLGVVAKQARAATSAELAQLKQATADVQQMLARTARAQMMSQLDKQVPNWRGINDDPAFLNWLGQKNQFSGRTRNDHLQDAWRANDAARVMEIFRAFENEARSQPRPDPYPGYGQQQAQVAGHGRDWPTTGKPVIRGQQITNFYNDVAAGKYAHRPEQKAALEAALNAAVREGRVVN